MSPNSLQPGDFLRGSSKLGEECLSGKLGACTEKKRSMRNTNEKMHEKMGYSSGIIEQMRFIYLFVRDVIS